MTLHFGHDELRTLVCASKSLKFGYLYGMSETKCVSNLGLGSGWVGNMSGKHSISKASVPVICQWASRSRTDSCPQHC